MISLPGLFYRWIVPNLRSDLKERVRREAYLTNEIIIRQELLRAKKEEPPASPTTTLRQRTMNGKHTLSDIVGPALLKNQVSAQLEPRR